MELSRLPPPLLPGTCSPWLPWCQALLLQGSLPACSSTNP